MRQGRQNLKLLYFFVGGTSIMKSHRANTNEVLQFHVALRQRNVDKLETIFYDVSDPESSNYGKHWSKSDILDLIAPEAEESDKVVQFLEMNGAFDVINHRDVIVASAMIEDIERIFSTKMFHYLDLSSSMTIICSNKALTIPKEIESVVHLIAGLTELPGTSTKPLIRKEAVHSPATDNGINIPESLQRIYNIPTNIKAHPNSSIAVVEYLNSGSYLQSDLALFAKQTLTSEIQVAHVVGNPNTEQIDLEPTLDVQYGASTSQGAQVWYWSSKNWLYENAVYMNAADPAPLVVSISWGFSEYFTCVTYARCTYDSSYSAEIIEYTGRVNVEYMKLGLRGVTILVASGDSGSLGFGNADCSNKTVNPSFPASSPYITSVGGTMLAKSNNKPTGSNAPFCKINQKGVKGCSSSNTEILWTYPEGLGTSGGGFDMYNAMPEYQKYTVEAYLKSGVTLPNAYFNESARAYPDIAGLGHNFGVMLSGAIAIVDGTSCSAPTVGGMIAILNSYRLNNNKPTLGFLNPLLYKAPSNIYNDITSGNNGCSTSCCDAERGFTAAPGWDATSGFGTLNFKTLLAYVETLN
eukprot:gene15366-18227_t